MPYCGRYGCGCCTCKTCGGYNSCTCKLKEETEALLKKDSLDFPQDTDYVDVLKEKLQDWVDKF